MTETTMTPEMVEEPMMLPRLPARRPSKDELRKYQQQMAMFAKNMQQLQAKIPRKVSSRGWCYIMEGMRVINKGEFDLVEKAINDCRKEGLLPLDFVDADESRKFHNREEIVVKTKAAREYLVDYLGFLKDIDKHKDDVAYWQNQEYYIEMMVEKKDLLNLFKDTCEKYHVSIANAKGWSDLISRGQLARRFQQAEKLGLKPVLLYFGDFDIGGLLIADQLKSNMKDIEKATGYDPEGLIIDHFGLSFDFINKHKLTWIDGKDFVSGSGKAPDKTKRNVQEYIAKYGERKCEANAVLGIHEPNVIGLLEATIQKYLKNPFDVYDKAIKKTRAEVVDLMATQDMKRVIQGWIDVLEKKDDGIDIKNVFGAIHQALEVEKAKDVAVPKKDEFTCQVCGNVYSASLLWQHSPPGVVKCDGCAGYNERYAAGATKHDPRYTHDHDGGDARCPGCQEENQKAVENKKVVDDDDGFIFGGDDDEDPFSKIEE